MLTPSIPVLCYHDIFEGGSHSPALLGEHLDAVIDAGFTTITAAQLMRVLRGQAKAPQKGVVITFDDGHLSNFIHAAPELEKRNMTGVFFALTDFTMPGPARSNTDAPVFKSAPDCFRDALLNQNYEQFINESEIATLIAAGHEVHAHGCRHQACFRTPRPRHAMGHSKAHWAAWSIYDRFDPNLPTFSEGSAYVYDGFWPTGEANAQGEPLFRRRTEEERREFCRSDLTRSLERMRELNKASEQLFCWPWGVFDPVSEEELKRAGFAGAFTLERWSNSPGTDPFRINRLGVGKTKDGRWIQKRLAMYRRKATARVFFKKFRKKTEVGHVLYATDSVKLSGGSRQLVNNAKAMLDLGLKVTVAVPPDARIPSALPEAARVVTCDHFKRVAATAFLFRCLVRERGVDVIHTFHNKAYKAAALAKLMSRVFGGGFKLFIGRGVVFNPNALFGLWSRIADSMVVNSLACARSLTKVMVPMSRIQVVYNSFIPDGPPPPDRAARRKRGLRILYVGNEAPAKGLDTFLLACRELTETASLRDVEFVVAGVRKMGKFKDIITPKLAERLTSLGLLDHGAVLEQMNWADILVLSSRQESLPNILPEAFCAGLPVVCTRAGGVSELVHEGRGGLLCEVEDHACIAQKLRELMPDFERRVSMGQNNRAVVTSLLGNRRKGLELLRVYHGQRIQAPLPLESVQRESATGPCPVTPQETP